MYDYFYPSEETCIRMDEKKGNDYLIVLYSLSELDLPKIMKAYEKEIKSTKDAYQAVLNACGKNNIVPFDFQHFDNDKVKFTADVDTVSKNAIMPILIKIKHG